MQLQDGTLNNPAAEELLQYATEGCPVDCGKNWTITEMQAAINNSIHVSAELKKQDKPYVERQWKA